MLIRTFIAQKMKFLIKDIFIKCDQIRRKLLIWSHLLKKPLMKNFIFCAVLKTASNHGIVLKKLYKVITCNQKAWIKPCIDINTELRKKYNKWI